MKVIQSILTDEQFVKMKKMHMKKGEKKSAKQKIEKVSMAQPTQAD